MHKYIKRPIIIDAFQWFPGVAFPSPAFDELHAIAKMTGPDGEVLLTDERTLIIQSPHMESGCFVSVIPGDWIIRGINGEFYPCSQDVFEKTYDPAEASP